MTSSTSVEEHYGRGGLRGAILNALRAAGAPIETLSVEDLAPIDHFHTRGKATTLEFLRLASVHAETRVLDVGDGLRGAARPLASTADRHPRAPDEVRGLLAGLGLREIAWEDQSSAISLEFNGRRAAAAAEASKPSPPGLHLLVGPDDDAIGVNQAPNSADDRVRIILAAWGKGPAVGS
jgi:hypothetical protein